MSFLIITVIIVDYQLYSKPLLRWGQVLYSYNFLIL